MNQWLRENPKPDGSKYNLYKDGLRIYTTIDSRLQSIAEESVNEHMKSLQSEFLHKIKNQRKIHHHLSEI